MINATVRVPILVTQKANGRGRSMLGSIKTMNITEKALSHMPAEQFTLASG